MKIMNHFIELHMLAETLMLM